MRWLREDYPQLFAHPDLEGRLWLYALTFGLQGLLIWPPDAPERDLVATHHVHALRALVDAPPSAVLDPELSTPGTRKSWLGQGAWRDSTTRVAEPSSSALWGEGSALETKLEASALPHALMKAAPCVA